MKKSHLVSLLPLATFVLSLSTLSVFGAKENVKFTAVSATESVQEYYSTISDSLEGNDLLRELNALNSLKRKSLTTYADMRYKAKIFDADPDGSGKIVGFYDNVLVGPNWDSGATWNREHVWPNVRGGSLVEGDAHMTRPASTKTNSDRGSKGYGMSSYDPGQFVAYYRGAASRIIFYAAIADLNLKLVDDPLNYNGGNPKNSMGSLSEMLKWNLQYQPSDTSFTGDNDIARRTEINRNNQIHANSQGQGNRNPFIDHPEYACKIWGNTNAATRAACSISGNPGGNQGEQPGSNPGTETPTVVELESVELSVHEKQLAVGETFSLSIAYHPENATNKPTMMWYSNDEEVATVSNGVVTGHKNGTCNVVIVSDDGVFSDRCKVIVGTGKKDENTSNPISCGGNVTLTSVILSTISLLGVGLLLLRKKTNNE